MVKRGRLMLLLGAFTTLLGPAAAAEARRSAERPAGSVAQTTPSRENMQVLGSTALGGGGLNGDVAVVDNTAIVGAGLVPDTGYHTERYNPLPCFRVSAKVVDLSNPRRPTVVSTIPVPTGSAAADVDAIRVESQSFSGVLVAVALDDGPSQQGPTGCTPNAADPGPTFTDRGIVYYDVSDPANPVFLGRYQADADSVPPDAPPCAPPPQGSAVRCATGQHSVDLVQRRNGTLFSISTEPAANQGATIRPSGDVRIVDVTNPRAPVQVGAYPPLEQRPSAFSNNGCRPFSNGHGAEFARNGTRGLVAYMDAGLFHLDLRRPTAPSFLGRAEYGTQRAVEGNAAYVTSAQVGRRSLALLSEDDWNAPDTTLRIDPPASIAGPKFACEANFTLFDRDRDAQVYLQPGASTSREIAYVGRGCPPRGTNPEDPYLADPNGKIAFVDSARVAATQPGIPAAGCRFDVRVQRAQDAGAVAVVYGRVPAPPFAGDPRAVSPGGTDTGLRIPAAQIDTPDADALRSTICPGVSGGACAGGQTVTGALTDSAGEWGSLRVVDLTTPTAPRFTSSYQTERAKVFPPPDNGIYAPGEAEARRALAFVAWNSDGIRVLDLRRGTPTEVASFVPADRPDPTGTIPDEAQVVGVAVSDRFVVASDVNSGLYVLRYRDKTRPTRPRITGPRRTRDRTPTFRFASTDADIAPGSLRFRCSFDSRRLRPCGARVTRRLAPGRHVLRVQAFDPSGNASPIASVRVVIR